MLLTEFHGRANAVIDAAPSEVFAAITAIDRLPEWNERIAAVTRAPDTPLRRGVEWTVQMSIPRPPAKWPSRSRVMTYDRERMLFEHTSHSDDGNPSYVVWRWSVALDPGGARVTVEWTGHPKRSGGDSCSPGSAGSSSKARPQRPCTHSRTTRTPESSPLTRTGRLGDINRTPPRQLPAPASGAEAQRGFLDTQRNG